MKTLSDANKSMRFLKGWIGPSQWHALNHCLRGEEQQFFFDKVCEIADLIRNMPKTYEQDGAGKDAVIYLHYFKGGMDWHITEKDCDPDGEGQIQAFGLSDLGYGAELGYISIVELIQEDIELDLYFAPRTIEQLQKGETPSTHVLQPANLGTPEELDADLLDAISPIRKAL